MSDICGSWAWSHPEYGMSPFYCGEAKCHRDSCRTEFWRNRVKLVSCLIEEYRLRRFFTLTLDRNFISGKVDPWDYIHIPWSRIRKRLGRRNPDFRFVSVLESGKDETVPHIHGFTNVWEEQALWSRMWSECSGGQYVWIEQVKSPDLSEYVSKSLEVAKYVGKENLVAGYKARKNHHTLWRSIDLKAEFELTSDSGWCIMKENVFKETGELSDFYSQKGVWSYGKAESKR